MTAKKEPWKHAPKTAETRAKISASMRGNVNARNKRVSAENHGAAARISFPAHVWRALENRLAETGEMRSRFVANAVALTLGLPPVPTARRSLPRRPKPEAAAETESAAADA